MALAFPRTRRAPSPFDRHIKRLVWCALIGSLALLLPVTDSAFSDNASLLGGLGAIVVVIAVLTVVRDVTRYVHQETTRRVEAARQSRHSGACQAAEAIQDRVANLLSVTVGYVDFLSEDQNLPGEARHQARRALESALAASRAVSTFRQSLGCGPSTLQHWGAIVDSVGANAKPSDPQGPWWYDQATHTIRGRNHDSVAELALAGDERTGLQAGRLMAEAPALRDALGEAQHVAAMLLANPRRAPELDAYLHTVLERINDVLQRVDD